MNMLRTGLATLILGNALLLAGCGLEPGRPYGPNDHSATRSLGKRPHADSKVAQNVVNTALGLVDTRYRYGGRSPQTGFDCSGLVGYVFNKAARIQLARTSAEMAKHGKPVRKDDLRPGDLVFFNTEHRPRSHVGIYIGDGQFVHAPSSGGRVRTDTLRSGWFAPRFEEARSYLE